jgi:conjugative transposon TraM protein
MSNDITAIIDERVKIVSGSRVRIRLLDDVVINSSLLKKGTYLYGNVTNFRAQRIMIDINSIICNGRRLKVNLSVFDNDGQEGLFVPSSVFRDLTKNIGSQAGSQNIQVEQQSNTAAEFAASAMQDVYRSATQAISKEVKKNKALIKYNTQVFLINTKEKSKDNQSNEE